MRLEQRSVYGPVWTRRFGWDLGINLLPLARKMCTFDCVYCQYGTTPGMFRTKLLPEPDSVIAEWELQVRACHSAGMTLTHTTVSGNGEPTMHPHFAQFAGSLVHWRDLRAPDMKLAVLTNGYRLHDPKIRAALLSFDEPIVKLDAAVPEKWRSINQPLIPFSVERLIETLKECNGVIIQTMFMKDWNDAPSDIRAWKDALAEIRPREVQIYTVTRAPAHPDVQPVTDSQLLAIAEEATTELKTPVNAYI
jgi:wyosine [tRNA(Phe)-imidazoG37] synthetase (radical SAM superfamily)